MSAEATDGRIDRSTARLRDTLIRMGSLTTEGAARIDDVMRAMGIGFEEAGVELGLLTPEDLERAHAARQQPPTNDGIIEDAMALQKRSFKRNLPVKYVRTVKAAPALMLAHHADSTYSEQIRTLRTELLLLNSSPMGISIGVLSPCRGEGRTQLCAELAIAFSQLGQRTLLMDADLRRPRIHNLFETGKTLGLGQALTSGGVPELLNVENLPQLSVLIAGPSVPNPLELLTNGHFQRQMSDLRKQYNMIIIDTPPVSEFADGLAIASFADQVVIIGRSGSTPHKNLNEMLRRMGSTRSRIIGAVINTF
jgi:protein-tyrosine kinase